MEWEPSAAAGRSASIRGEESTCDEAGWGKWPGSGSLLLFIGGRVRAWVEGAGGQRPGGSRALPSRSDLSPRFAYHNKQPLSLSLSLPPAPLRL